MNCKKLLFWNSKHSVTIVFGTKFEIIKLIFKLIGKLFVESDEEDDFVATIRIEGGESSIEC